MDRKRFLSLNDAIYIFYSVRTRVIKSLIKKSILNFEYLTSLLFSKIALIKNSTVKIFKQENMRIVSF